MNTLTASIASAVNESNQKPLSRWRFRNVGGGTGGVSNEDTRLESSNQRSNETSNELVRDEIIALAEQLGVHRVVAGILFNRGLTDFDKASFFLSPTLRQGLPSPYDILNMDKGVELIVEGLRQKRSFAVFTDFDVDGITAGVQLYQFLKLLGAAVEVITPNRFTEGYGLNAGMIRKMASRGVEILITVDCGVANASELSLARELGLTTMVVDHHEVTSLPPANVVIDPMQDGCGFRPHALCAAGLVWMLIVALRSRLVELKEEPTEGVPDPKDFLELAAMGTICDMVPLTGVNRLIASRGLEALNKSKRAGIIALRRESGIADSKDVSVGAVGFQLGPRLNAAGRIHDANVAIELLSTQNEGRARQIASLLNRLNKERKAIEDKMKAACFRHIADMYGQLSEVKAFAVFAKEFHVGVIGIVAQRVVEHYYRPAAIMAPGEYMYQGKFIQVIKGSIRSIRGFSVAEALDSLKHLLLSGGGHASAGGFTILPEKLEEFCQAFLDCAGNTLSEDDFCRNVDIDASLRFADINYDLIKQLEMLAPYGIGNPSPVFLAQRVEVTSVTVISGDHLRLMLRQDGVDIAGVAWGMRENCLLRRGMVVDIAFSPEINEYRGLSSVQLGVKDVWLHG